MEEAITTLSNRLKQCIQNQKQLILLDSVSLGLYTEIDKLSKKAPAESVTDLALEQMNDVIRETKELIDSDPYIQRLNEFVAAGDNPQHRDAVIVLRQIRQGLERFRSQLDSLIGLLSSRLKDAKGIHIAIQLDLAYGSPIEHETLKQYGADLSQEWLSYGYPKTFNLTKLGSTNIKEYFNEAKLP